jgi:hypothetical protein
MAKTVGGIPTDCEGYIVGDGKPVSGKVRKTKEREIPWTPGPQTRWQKIKRAAVG